MSGLALFWHLDGRPASADDLAAMLEEMKRRGPDGEDITLSGPVALGHRHLYTTQEALIERMPISDPARGRVLTGDIRLDNREDLLTTFGLTQSGRTVGDAELVLRAFERWGAECASHLLGDFAFAIWDPRKANVFAARDQTGMRQLIYTYRDRRFFVCATSARAVALAPDVSPPLNELRLAEALIGFEWGNQTSTFFEGIFRLPPGHCLIADKNGAAVRSYWTMTPPEPLHLSSNREYADGFREVMSSAIQARMRGAGPVGSMLSGGMDSGSVVALASRMVTDPLPTFSAVGPDPTSCAETRAIHAALTMPNLEPTLIDYSALGPWKHDLIAAWLALDEPWDFHMTVPRAAYVAAQRAGVKVVLDGVAGDVMLGEGSQMARQLRSGRFGQAWLNARGLTSFYGMAPGYTAKQLFQATRSAFVPNILRRLSAVWRDSRLPPLPEGSAIDAGFADRVGLRQVLHDWERVQLKHKSSFAEERIWSWARSGLTVGRERYDRVAAHFGIEPRDPYMDRRVWEFCLSVPFDQLQANGWPKIIQRRAFAGMLPDAVRWRQGKEHLGWTFTQSLWDEWPDWHDSIRASRKTLSGRARASLLDQPACKRTLGKPVATALDTLLHNSLTVNNISQKL